MKPRFRISLEISPMYSRRPKNTFTSRPRTTFSYFKDYNHYNKPLYNDVFSVGDKI